MSLLMLYSYFNFDRICLLHKTRCWRCRYLSSYIIHWMSSLKVASRQRSRLFKLADFQLWHTWNFHEGNSAYIAKVFWRQKQNLSNHNNQNIDCFNLTNFFKFFGKCQIFEYLPSQRVFLTAKKAILDWKAKRSS